MTPNTIMAHLGHMFELGPYCLQAEDTIFYTNGYESILTENWRCRAVSNKDLLGGRQFLGINNENKKKRTIWSLQHHKQHYICRVEEEYACDLVYLPRLPLYKLDGYERFEELVRHDQRIFINSDICMSIRRLEIRINANTDVPKGWYSRLTKLQKHYEKQSNYDLVNRYGTKPFRRPPRLFWPKGPTIPDDFGPTINIFIDPWTVPRSKWYAFRQGNTADIEEELLCFLMSAWTLPCHDQISTLEGFRIYKRLSWRERHGCTPLTLEEKNTMAKMHPLYLQQKNERYLRKKLEKSKQKDIDDEADWRRKLSPKRSDYSLKVSVLAFGLSAPSRRPWVIGRYTHQCMFCQELFTDYPLLHMRMCIKQLDAPLSLLKAYLLERQDYYECFIDKYDDVEDVILPRNEKTKRLIKPVFRQCANQIQVHGKYVKFWDMPEVGRTDAAYLYYYQCQFCKQLHQTYQSLTKHVSACTSRDASTNDLSHQKSIRIPHRHPSFYPMIKSCYNRIGPNGQPFGRVHDICYCTHGSCYDTEDHWGPRLDMKNDRHPNTCSKWLCRPCMGTGSIRSESGL